MRAIFAFVCHKLKALSPLPSPMKTGLLIADFKVSGVLSLSQDPITHPFILAAVWVSGTCSFFCFVFF